MRPRVLNGEVLDVERRMNSAIFLRHTEMYGVQRRVGSYIV